MIMAHLYASLGAFVPFLNHCCTKTHRELLYPVYPLHTSLKTTNWNRVESNCEITAIEVLNWNLRKKHKKPHIGVNRLWIDPFNAGPFFL